MRKVTIFGSSSMIGNQLFENLTQNGFDVTGISRKSSRDLNGKFDLYDYKNINYDFLDKCDILIIVAAISSPDLCEKEVEYCYRINVSGTKYLIDRAIEKGCKVIFFSSDAVFGKDNGYAFDEDSLKKPISNYGKMKSEIEDIFENNSNFKTLRLSYVFSYYDKFTKYYLSNLRNNELAEIFHPLYRNVVCIDDVNEVVNKIIKNWDLYYFRKINLCGKELLSRVNIVDAINRHLNINCKYSIVEMDENFLDIRPKITQMKSNYMRDILDSYDTSFFEKVSIELSKYKI